jgi:Tfp pilus assembly protein PilN
VTFSPDPFDIAPAARRPTRVAWLAVLAALCFLLFCAFVLDRAIRSSQHAQEQSRIRSETQRLRAQHEAEARLRATDPATLEKLRAQQEIQQALGMSWSGILEAFELAAKKVDGSVSLTSIAYVKSVKLAAEVRVAGMALSNDSLLRYLKALKEQPLVKDVRLISHTAGQGTNAATSRFQLVVISHPRLSIWPERQKVE